MQPPRRGPFCTLVGLFLTVTLLGGTSLSAHAFQLQDEWRPIREMQPLHGKTMEPGELARYQVLLDAAPAVEGLVAPGDALVLDFGSGERTFSVRRATSFVPGTVSVSATVPGSHDHLTITFRDGDVLGAFHTGGEFFVMRSDGDQVVFSRMESAGLDVLGCGIGHDETVMPAAGTHAGKTDADLLVPHHMASLADAVNDPITIDLMIVYTGNARQWAEAPGNPGSIELVIAQAMNFSQLALDNSDVFINLRLVHTREVFYDEVGAPTSIHLRRLTTSPTFQPWGTDLEGHSLIGFMDEVHSLRSQYGADLVAMFAEIGDVGGTAWLLGSVGGSPALGFSVNRVQQIWRTYTLVHEIGHNMGSMHSRNQQSAAAAPRGGIFPYSTGWRWTALNGLSYNSVMTYSDGSMAAPLFSNPNILFEGTPSGSYTGLLAPADNARSLRETKRVVAAYMPVTVDPPAVSLSSSRVDVGVNPDQVRTHTFRISNTGDSDLVWDLDYAPPASAKAAKTTIQGPVVDGAGEDGAPAEVHSLSPTADAPDGVIYQTSFESSEGFSQGQHQLRSLWAVSGNTATFRISSGNPTHGTQHLRLGSVEGHTGAIFLYSPVTGPQPRGTYVFEADVRINMAGSLYYLDLYDTRTGATTAGLVFGGSEHGRAIFAFTGFNQSGQVTYGSTGQTWTEGALMRLRVEVDAATNTGRYLINGNQLASYTLVGGQTIGQLRLVRSAGTASDHLDLDNMSIRRERTGIGWFTADRLYGITRPGETSDVVLTFDGSAVATGTHRGDLVLATNQANARQVRIPVEMEVAVGANTDEAAIPIRTALEANYPNPFNPVTTIGYQTGAPGHVTIEVFSLTGQRVAVVVDEVRAAGMHEARFDASGLPSGTYFYRMQTGEQSITRPMTLLK
jgi:hypothetical protein